MNAIQPTPENLRVWNRFCATPSHATKPFNKGGFKGTDINPAYRLRCLTELFGPQGTGWGWTIHERWREVWPSRVKDGDEWVDYEAPCAFVMLSLWYVEDGVKHECSPQIGGTECDLAPDEVWKMSITDAIGKCCLALGIAADVYMGQFDGKYRDGHDQPRQQQRPSKPACPKCKKSEFVLEDRNTQGAFFCWRNPEKQKLGCGHKWNPNEEAKSEPSLFDPVHFDTLKAKVASIDNAKKFTLFRAEAATAYGAKHITAPQLGELIGLLVHKSSSVNSLNELGKWIADVRIEMDSNDAKCFDEVEQLIESRLPDFQPAGSK